MFGHYQPYYFITKYLILLFYAYPQKSIRILHTLSAIEFINTNMDEVIKIVKGRDATKS